jgi:hypothetical protein
MDVAATDTDVGKQAVVEAFELGDGATELPFAPDVPWQPRQ